MEFSHKLILFGVVLLILGLLVQTVRAFQENLWWGVAYLFIPCACLVFIVNHWARARGSFFFMLMGVAFMGIGAVTGDKGLSVKSLFAAVTSSSDEKDVESLTASIAEKRTRIESLEDQFQVQGTELAKQFQNLDQRRKELNASDADEVQRFNVEAEAYRAQNNAQKAMGAELESARKELTALLDERARLRPSNPSVPVQNAAPARNSDTATATVGANRKRVVMYTMARCPACVAAKSYLSRRGVYYEERDVERSSEALKEFQSLGGRSVPLILVGNEQMVGFNPQRFERMIGG